MKKNGCLVEWARPRIRSRSVVERKMELGSWIVVGELQREAVDKASFRETWREIEMVRVVPWSNWGGGRHVRDAPKRTGWSESRPGHVDLGAVRWAQGRETGLWQELERELVRR